MKKQAFQLPTFTFVLSLLLLIKACDPGNGKIYEGLLEQANRIKVINTHEHQRWPGEIGELDYRFQHLVNASYLMADIASAGGRWMGWEDLDRMSLDQWWDINGQALDYTRTTSYYTHFVKGFRKLYGFEDPYFTASNAGKLSDLIRERYGDYRSWFDEAFHRAGFELMFLDQYWAPFNTDVAKDYFALVFNINLLVMQAGARPGPGGEAPEIFRRAAEDGMEISTLDDYLEYCDTLLRRNLECNVVCLKNSMAYSRSLFYEDVSHAQANELFEKISGSLTAQEAKRIQDFVFHWIIRKSIEYDLPIQIHTGYLAGNGNTLENGRPVRLNNLFLKYPEAKFVLFHGGYPWTGEFAALGKMFPNVYLDLVWLPQISREEAVHALDEMFDAVPYNKFFWGGDCHFIEESAGSLEYGREVVAEVLAKRVERGVLTMDVAGEILQRIFRENAIEVFRLEQKLSRF